jgi:hypothetical protein
MWLPLRAARARQRVGPWESQQNRQISAVAPLTFPPRLIDRITVKFAP